jgi:endonuclease/exonuclease/phosphatase family metal-dependent hydrolase
MVTPIRRRRLRGIRLTAGALALGLAGDSCTAVRGPGAESFRVMVYNIHAGKDAAGVDNLERVADVIRHASADIVLLQEVDRGTQRSAGVDQPAVLSQRTGLHVAFGKSLAYQGGDYGIAILSRWPIGAQRTLPLVLDPPQVRAGGSYEPRVALGATLSTPMGELRILNTHLDASREDQWRRQEVARILAIADSLPGLVLIGGDFNSTPESDVQQAVRSRGLRDAWTTCGRAGDEGLTYPADSSVKRIDYLFFRGATSCARAEVLVTQASDHRPLIVEVTMRSRPNRK